MKPINLIGKRFVRLKVLSYDSSSKGSGHAWWVCECLCGNKVSVRASRLKSGTTRSCGCLAKELAKELLSEYSRSDFHKGKGNPQWKGDEAKHSSIHTWLNRYYKKEECEECGTKKLLEFALKKGRKHGHHRNRYKVLCRSHHMSYDYKHKMR